jgi:hypothetical protein
MGVGVTVAMLLVILKRHIVSLNVENMLIQVNRIKITTALGSLSVVHLFNG